MRGEGGEGGRGRGGGGKSGGEGRGGEKGGRGGRLWGEGGEGEWKKGRRGKDWEGRISDGVGRDHWMTSCFVSFFWFFVGRQGGVGRGEAVEGELCRKI